jgi:hypothetical protein
VILDLDKDTVETGTPFTAHRLVVIPSESSNFPLILWITVDLGHTAPWQ